MSAFLRKYGTGTGADVYVPMIKRAVVDFAVGADWSPSAGDVKISKDGAAAANIGTLPTAVTMGNTAMWKFVFADAELQCKVLSVTVADSATKAVEDQMFNVETYGNASAMYKPDFSDSVRLGLTALPNAAAEAAGGLFTRGTGAGQINQQANGQIDANLERIQNVAQSVTDLKDFADTGYDPATHKLEEVKVLTGHTAQTGDTYARLGAPAGASVSADLAAVKTDTGNLVTRITSTLFSGITSLAQWLGAMAGKQSPNSTAQTEIRATGAGSGGFDATTDSQEALRDNVGTNGAALSLAKGAQVTGFNDLDAAGVRGAVGLASANLDTQIGTLATASALSAVSSNVSTLLSRIPAALFAGITSLAEWLGLIAGKQTGNSTARTELRATGAGSGAYDETTDSQEAIRDRGDSAWTTATGFSTHTASDVWAVGTRTLTSFGTLVSDIATAVWSAVTRTLTAATNITSNGGTTVPQTGDSFARLGAPAGASVSADLAAVKVDTAAIKAKTDSLPEAIKKNQALAAFEFLMVDTADHVTGMTGLAVTAEVSIDGGAFAACTNSPTEVAFGVYKIDLSAADLNGNVITLKFTAAGADATILTFKTAP